ncbi:hypothetical protein LA76x_3721 [Lysobacter antibioticus]|uniref:Uncharacterized protein n=1 Tax=Lysobacter antibioticus TaxID=84531 RepID=A0A0S2FE87_LYSAN|nr:hypothetical protein LA76x_3721 [Lysobacter antibioticus]
MASHRYAHPSRERIRACARRPSSRHANRARDRCIECAIRFVMCLKRVVAKNQVSRRKQRLRSCDEHRKKS